MIPQALQEVLPQLLTAWDALTDAAASQGITFQLNDFGGVRTQADTTLILQYRDTDYAAALARGAIQPDTTLQQFRPISPFGNSYHNYGAAFDVSPSSYPGSYSAAVNTLGSLAPSCGLRWGGHFSNADPAHFELNTSLAEVKAMWQNWQASAQTSDDLTTSQQVTVAAHDPMLWAMAAVIGYTGYVIWQTIMPHRRIQHERA